MNEGFAKLLRQLQRTLLKEKVPPNIVTQALASWTAPEGKTDHRHEGRQRKELRKRVGRAREARPRRDTIRRAERAKEERAFGRLRHRVMMWLSHDSQQRGNLTRLWRRVEQWNREDRLGVR